MCSIAEYFMSCAVHWRARRASFPSKSFCSFLIKQEKQRGKRSVARAADWLNSFFYNQNNQLSRLPYNIAGYMYSVRTSFALYFGQLDNNKKYMYLKLFKIIVLKEWFQKTIWLLYFRVQSPPSLTPPPPLLLPSRYQFFNHGTLSSSPFIPLPTLWLTCPSSTSSLLPTGCQYFLHNKLSLFPFPISHPSIHSFIDPLVLLSLQPSSHPLSTTLFLSLSLKFVWQGNATNELTLIL